MRAFFGQLPSIEFAIMRPGFEYMPMITCTAVADVRVLSAIHGGLRSRL